MGSREAKRLLTGGLPTASFRRRSDLDYAYIHRLRRSPLESPESSLEREPWRYGRWRQSDTALEQPLLRCQTMRPPRSEVHVEPPTLTQREPPGARVV